MLVSLVSVYGSRLSSPFAEANLLTLAVTLAESLKDLLNNPNKVLPPDGTEEGLCLSDPRNHPQLNEVSLTVQP